MSKKKAGIRALLAGTAAAMGVSGGWILIGESWYVLAAGAMLYASGCIFMYLDSTRIS
jgi:hypothetical protein